jgi:co-chaperonin GroES (HSP10)
MTSIAPVGHRVLVDYDKANLETEWGFQLGGDRKLEDAAMISGKLAAVGNQAWKAFGPNFTGEPWAEVGDHVYYAQYSGKTVTDPVDGKMYKIMNDEDITAVIKAQE